MGTDLDLLGFTRQTETLLRGVGAHDLVKEFKTRNISTDALHKLTKEDFVQLGASKDQAENIFNSLCISKKKKSNPRAKPHHRICNKEEILCLGEKQLSIIQDYVKYCKLKLGKEKINFFVEPNKALSASQVLCIAINAVLEEVIEAELKLKELEAVIITTESSKSRKHSYILYSITFGGLCIATGILLKRFWR